MEIAAVTSPLQRRTAILVQVLCAFVANMVNIAPGMNLGFSAIALPPLQNQNATFHVNDDEASWIGCYMHLLHGMGDALAEGLLMIRLCFGAPGASAHTNFRIFPASIASIATPLGCIITGAILDRIGRKMTLILLNLPCLLGWLLIAFAEGDDSLGMIYCGRFFTGLATGMASVPATVYSAEISSPSLRGMFVTWTSISISIGILLVYFLGYMMPDNWRMVAGASAVFPVVAIVLIYFILPETPSWLMSKNRLTEALRSIKKVRGCAKNEDMPLSVAEEYETMLEKFKSLDDDDDQDDYGVPIKRTFRQIYFRAGTIKPFIIMNMFFFFQQFSGIFVIIFYAVKVVEEAGITWNPYLVTIFIGLTRVCVTIFMSYVFKKYGKRPPCIVSGAGMTICMGTLATYLYLQTTNKLSEEAEATWGWIPVTSLLLYILTSTIGFLTLPWAMVGEIFPAEVRGLAAGMTTCFAYIFNFLIVKMYPDMIRSLSEYGVFFFYGTFAVMGTVFVVLFLPETQGKTLLEIEEYFNRKKEVRRPSFNEGDIELMEIGNPLPSNVSQKL